MEIDVLLFRQVRYMIVQVCQYVYRQEWDKVREEWTGLDLKLDQIIPETEIGYEALCESRICIEKGNYLRFHDLLVYDIDFYIAEQLRELNETDRKRLAEEARKENERALVEYHNSILPLINYYSKTDRIEFSYIGTENVSISIKDKEGEGKFRLFSIVNPCLESVNFANNIKESILDEIYVLGFGGGHLIRELARRYPDAKIKIYISNIDVFKAVIYNISVGDILENRKIELIYDPACFDFFAALVRGEGSNSKYAVYIDRQELRAHIGNVRQTDKLLMWYQSGMRVMLQRIGKQSIKAFSGSIEDNVGIKIYRYIKDLSMYS